MKKWSPSLVLSALRLARIKRITANVLAKEASYRCLSDEELAAQTQVFRRRLSQGASVDDLLVEAFATVREACRRVVGQFPYPVQVMGAVALHKGYIAEMKTGEGKTLTATMPLYLNALTGQGALLVTVNDYLAKRDGEEMGAVYQFLGMSVGINLQKQSDTPLPPEQVVQEKRAVYGADITYTTSATLGFDYLAHNLSASLDQQFMRPFHYAIIDEADAVLLDSAQMPLIISGFPRVQSNLYDLCDQLVRTLKEGEDIFFHREKKEVYLTRKGEDRAAAYLAIDSLYTSQHWEVNRHLNLALRAHYLFQKKKDYLVQGNEVKLLDKRTGRILEGTRIQSGLHQAIEIKERVKKTKESRAIASITYQSLFGLFPKLAGMTGTGLDAEEELLATYGLGVVVIPTNHPIRRQDLPDRLYASLPEKLAATIDLVRSYHSKGQPVLLVSGSVEVTQIYSKMLLQEGIPHSTLTASDSAKEAAIIREAGQKGVVTCATIMAGRGTDIRLGEGVAELGGLVVIGTERMPNSRMDWQIRGRSGRQGEPGLSQFLVSLEDELVVGHGAEWLRRWRQAQASRPSQSPLRGRRFHRAVAQAQQRSEDESVLSRRLTIGYDESLRVQRTKIYALRQRLLTGEEDVVALGQSIVQREIHRFLSTYPRRSKQMVHRYVLDSFTYRMPQLPADLAVCEDDQVARFLYQLFEQEMAVKAQIFQTADDQVAFYRTALLKAIDEAWVEEVDTLQQLKGVITTRVTAQRDSLSEYIKASHASYQSMTQAIEHRTLRHLMLSTVTVDEKGTYSLYFV